MSTVPTVAKRYLYSQINSKAAGLCIVGDRGVGKTTMVCQNLLERYKTPNRALYVSADHVTVLSYGLINIAVKGDTASGGVPLDDDFTLPKAVGSDWNKASIYATKPPKSDEARLVG